MAGSWSRSPVVFVGLAWSLVLVVAGWKAAMWASPPALLPGPAVLLGGLTMIAMGQFVFAALVCGRMFPGAGRAVAAWELVCGAAFIALGLATAAAAALGATR